VTFNQRDLIRAGEFCTRELARRYVWQYTSDTGIRRPGCKPDKAPRWVRRDHFEELENVAVVGLLKAARSYDPYRPGAAPFGVYASHAVAQELNHHLRDVIGDKPRDDDGRPITPLHLGTPAEWESLADSLPENVTDGEWGHLPSTLAEEEGGKPDDEAQGGLLARLLKNLVEAQDDPGLQAQVLSDAVRIGIDLNQRDIALEYERLGRDQDDEELRKAAHTLRRAKNRSLRNLKKEKA
jgi:hypothetical protein